MIFKKDAIARWKVALQQCSRRPLLGQPDVVKLAGYRPKRDACLLGRSRRPTKYLRSGANDRRSKAGGVLLHSFLRKRESRTSLLGPRFREDERRERESTYIIMLLG